MKAVFLVLCVACMPLFSQALDRATDPTALSLKQRFEWMKSNSETYGEYKVVKESLLNLAWMVVDDSIRTARMKLRNTRDSIGQLRRELAEIQGALMAKEEQLRPLEYAGAHLSVGGISFSKNGFVGLFVLSLGVLLTALALVLTRMKQSELILSEKSDALGLLSREYEDYKRRALEKQMKLSRELQSERNRHAEPAH